MVKKKRSPKEREPVGKTKSLILIYIADKENCTMTDIRRYLRDNLNIINQKVVRRHVADLVSNRLLKIKKQEGRGKPDYYFIDNTFSAFKNCFNYLHSNNFSVDLLKTHLARSILSSDDFFLFGLAYVVKELILPVFNVMRDELRFNEVITAMSRELGTKETEYLKEWIGNIVQPYLSKYLPEIENKTPEELIQFVQETFPKVRGIIPYLINELFPQEQKEEIINIISTSPSALDYFLNLKTENELIFVNIFSGFLIRVLSQYVSKPELIDTLENPIERQDFKKFTNIFKAFVNKANVLRVNPILTILKALFIQDAVKGKIIVNEYSKKELMSTLTQTIKSNTITVTVTPKRVREDKSMEMK